MKIFAAELLANIVYNTYYMARKIDICNVLKDRFARSVKSNDRSVHIPTILQTVLECKDKRKQTSLFWAASKGLTPFVKVISQFCPFFH